VSGVAERARTHTHTHTHMRAKWKLPSHAKSDTVEPGRMQPMQAMVVRQKYSAWVGGKEAER
jgi:hypothetical protein